MIGTNHEVNISNVEEIVDLVTNLDVDLVIVGPEGPLVDGLSNRMSQIGIREKNKLNIVLIRKFIVA
mgnify:CR=1 FL=1